MSLYFLNAFILDTVGLVLYFVILFLSNVTSTIFSQQILGGKLLLVFNWDNHFKLCIKKTKEKTNG